jgi:hypothetical protein
VRKLDKATNSSDTDEEKWGISRSKSLGVYDDRSVLDVRKSGGRAKCRKVSVVKNV